MLRPSLISRSSGGSSRGGAAAAPNVAAAPLRAATTHRRRQFAVARASADDPKEQQQQQVEEQQQQDQKPKRRQADSTDAIASAITRRFGIAGGLAWVAFLTVGTLGEQIKTRLEVAAEQSGARDVDAAAAKEVVLPTGVSYVDQRVGGGQTPAKGMLVVLNFVARTAEDGAVFEDTRARGKPIVYIFGGRPFTGGLCAGVEEALSTMRAGGKRLVRVPADRGFGERGAVLRPTEHVPEKQGVIPPGAALVYELDLLRVSVPPS